MLKQSSWLFMGDNKNETFNRNRHAEWFYRRFPWNKRSSCNCPEVAKKIGDTITFTYDFGDDWTFPIRLEEIIDDEVYEEASPLVLDGEGLGIIEDVGGVGALSDCVKAFEKKSGDDYESYSEWLGLKELDITYFNKSAVNKSLKNEIKAIDKAYKTME